MAGDNPTSVPARAASSSEYEFFFVKYCFSVYFTWCVLTVFLKMFLC